jgi:glycosyltransferase involved in cell wall biosynthesis
MADVPFFTVGVPTYNRAKIFPEAVRAILGQSFGDFELLLADNHSADETPTVAAQIQDPRVQYFRHEKNLGALGNFNFLAHKARGEFFIVCQDDDLLHRDFLKRCHESVVAQPDVVMYASPWWRGNATQGYLSNLMRDRDGKSEEYIINDRPLVLDGKRAAVSLLHSFYLLHPAIAFRTRELQAIGCYHNDPDSVFDVVTEVRLLCRGKLIYDPRIGAVFRDHSGNFSRAIDKQSRIIASGKMFHQTIADLENHQVDWQRLLAEDLDQYSYSEILKIFGEWTRYAAPRAVQEIGWRVLWAKNPRTKTWLWKRLISRVGFGNLLRFARARTR